MVERTYLGSVSEVALNGYYAAVLFEGKIQLHLVRGGEAGLECREECCDFNVMLLPAG